MDNLIRLDRAYLPDGSGTLGCWQIDQARFHTLERPWFGNSRNTSCIPEGVYVMGLRRSTVVERTSNGAYSRGWEIQDVPGRSFIMCHVGNYVRNSEGCVLIGSGFSWDATEGPMVTRSQDGFAVFMELMGARESWSITVRNKGVQYP
jgi:hypothetical protein